MVLKTIAAAFSMFSKIPMPRVDWDGGSLRYMLCAFPLVGAVCGGLLLLWTYLAGLLGLGNVLFAAGATLLPVAVTGGVHLDGFCDVLDALASHAPPERKREILKDPHAGAFAVIGLCAYLLAYFAVATELSRELETAALVGLSYMLIRTLSGLSVICFPASGGAGLLRTFRESAAKKRAAAVLFCEFAVIAAAMLWLSWPSGAVMVFAPLACLLCLRLLSKRSFGGMSGDLAGWFLQTAELVSLAALIFTRLAWR